MNTHTHHKSELFLISEEKTLGLGREKKDVGQDRLVAVQEIYLSVKMQVLCLCLGLCWLLVPRLHKVFPLNNLTVVQK